MVKYLTFILLLHFSIAICHAQKPSIKAAFIFNFTKYIEWPLIEGKNFKIAVWNDNEMVDALEVLAF